MNQVINGYDLIERLGIDGVDLNSNLIKSKFDFSHSYKVLEGQDRDDTILSVVSSLESHKFRVSGENDNTVWEKGWGEVLSAVKNAAQFSTDLLLPQYFKKENISRLFGNYVASDSDQFEFDLDMATRLAVFSKYLVGHKRVVEIGSGTGTSQYLLSQLCAKSTELVGSDWATPSIELMKTISEKVQRPIHPVLFNMLTLEGYENLKICSDTVVFTVHTLEQLGKSYQPLLNKLLESKPAMCVHIEPIKELYDRHNLIDYLAIKYHEIRNYLDGWLTSLKDLESLNKVKIIKEQRIQLGNKFHDAYNLVIWQPT